MGVKNLQKLLNEYAPEAVHSAVISDFAGTTVGIDASISVFQWCSIGVRMGIKNKKSQWINHIQGCFFRTAHMLLEGISPVYIFDGAAPIAKNKVLLARKEKRLAEETPTLPVGVFEEVRVLLGLMGVPIVDAVGEAEAQAAALTNTGSIDAVATEDMDALAFGARKMIRGLDTKATGIKVMRVSEVLTSLGLNMREFIDLCILLGTDYTCGVPGVGYKKALALIRKYKTIEKIATVIKLPQEFDYKGARAEFKKPKISKRKFSFKVKRLDAASIYNLEDYLINKHGLQESRVKKTLHKLRVWYSVH